MMQLLRGAKPSPRHRLAAAMPHRVVTPTPPQFLWFPNRLDMWLNDKYGCCVSAEECFAKACYSPEIFITEDTLLAFAQKNNLLNGSDLITVLDLMETNGFPQDGHTYDDGPPLAVNWTDRPTLTNAIAQGPVKIAVAADQLESTVQALSVYPIDGWLATGYTSDSNLDHCTSLCGYGPAAWLLERMGVAVPMGVDGNAFAYAIFTWASIGVIDEPSMLAITGEAWLRQPTTIIN